MTRLSFSVVVNTYNRAGLLRDTLESLTRLRHPLYEIVVVNGPSTDTTEAVLNVFRDRIKIRACPQANLSASRNMGVAASAGDIVAFIDDDATAEPNWLCELEPAYNDPKVGVVGGFTRDHTGYDFQWQYMVTDWLANGCSYKDRKSAGLEGHLRPGGFLYPSGVNSSFRRNALIDSGGFDEAYAYYADETDLTLRMIERGYIVRCMPAAQVHHRYAESHIRSRKHVPKAFYEIARSRGYFAARHAFSRMTIKDALAACGKCLSEHREHVLCLSASGTINHSVSVRLLRELDEGTRNSLTDALQKSGPKLRTKTELESAEELLLQERKLPPRAVLRICFVTEELPPDPSGGIGVWVWTSARGLAAAGHEVSIVTTSSAHSTVEFKEGIWIHRVQRRRHAGRRMAKMPEVHPGLQDYLFSVRDEALRIHSVRGLDLIVAPIWNVQGLALIASEEIPVVVSLHTPMKTVLSDRPDWQRDANHMRWLNMVIDAEKWCLENASAILANSGVIIETIEAQYNVSLRRERTLVVPHGLPDCALGVDTSRSESDELTVLYVGRQEPRKGIDLLLDSVPLLAAKYPKLRFVLAGEERAAPGEDMTYTAAFRQRHSTADWLERVEFRGFVSQSDLEALYRECDIFVAPSRFESFGLVYLEAMRYGKPVVACRSGAVVEIIEDGVNGRLADPEDSQKLADAIEDLVISADQRLAIGAAARRTFLRQFTLEHMTVGTVEALSIALNQSRIGAPSAAA